MKPEVLQLCPLSPKLDAALAAEYQIHRLWEQEDVQRYLADQDQRIIGIATAAPVGVPAAVMAALPELRVISCRGVGLDKIDLEAAKQREIQVAGTFGMLSDCVADMAFALLLDCARQLSAADRFVRAGKWQQARYPLTTRLSGKRLGIVGLGQIGRLVAKRASGFDMQVAYTNRRRADGVAYRFEPELVELARWSDFLVIAAAGGADTHHLIDARVLEALGPSGYLVNVSRGSVVDEAALLEALLEGRIAGAGLDVFAHEPNIPRAFLSLDNVVLAPHMGSGTVETREAMEDLVLENLRAFFSEGQVRTPAF